jgi:hypothetical protein
MKTSQERIEEMTKQKMVNNLHQIKHILNGLIEGKIYDGSKLDTDKLVDYKLAVSKVEGMVRGS